jgi:hypothetical protein
VGILKSPLLYIKGGNKVALIDDVKLSLRLSSTVYNTEVTDLIATAKADLLNCGILVTSESDVLIKRLIILYCKANFGYDNTDAGRMQLAYEMLRNHVTLVGDYAYYTVTFTAKNSSAVAIKDAIVWFAGENKQTNLSGVAIFHVRGGSYDYEVTHKDYADYNDSEGEYIDVDISANTSINITMEA